MTKKQIEFLERYLKRKRVEKARIVTDRYESLTTFVEFKGRTAKKKLFAYLTAENVQPETGSCILLGCGGWIEWDMHEVGPGDRWDYDWRYFCRPNW